ncbi:serine hydrolase domain-containing protein [Streptomyces sp. SYP-A7185]|uniref:serine hydrolase domain-containing protein n=1 Tax=Streptomyces sp. SYP-A7185 TaxID=3040076 RepID=UPI0038F71506
MSPRGAASTGHEPAPATPAWAADLLDGLREAAPGASAIALGVRRGSEHVVIATGRTAWHGAAPAGPDTRFETGSLTKTFTAVLLAEMAARGEVALDDPIARFLPRGAAPHLPVGRITLLHLATHTSGLPRLPPGFLRRGAPAWFSNPYAGYSPAELRRALARTRPRAAPGTRVHYSNFGVGLLGILLTRAGAHGSAGPDAAGAGPADDGFARLLAGRVLEPLGLTRTDCAADRPQATGYWHRRARPAWRMPALPAAGAVRSSARDLLTTLDALLDPAGPPALPATLRTALAEVATPRLALPRTGRRIGLVWNLRPRPGHDLWHHSGGTRGFTAFAGFSPQTGVALTALANTGPVLTGAFIQRAYLDLRALARDASTA